MNINYLPVVDFKDIEEELGTSYKDYIFVEAIENDSYQYLGLDEEAVENCKDCISFYTKKENFNRVHKYENELKLINYFRQLGYKDAILIFISW